MEIKKLYPDLCKHDSCLARADYEFTDIETVKTEQKDGLKKEEVKNRTLGYACFNHVVEVSKMLKDIHGRREKK